MLPVTSSRADSMTDDGSEFGVNSERLMNSPVRAAARVFRLIRAPLGRGTGCSCRGTSWPAESAPGSASGSGNWFGTAGLGTSTRGPALGSTTMAAVLRAASSAWCLVWLRVSVLVSSWSFWTEHVRFPSWCRTSFRAKAVSDLPFLPGVFRLAFPGVGPGPPVLAVEVPGRLSRLLSRSSDSDPRDSLYRVSGPSPRAGMVHSSSMGHVWPRLRLLHF